MCTCTVYNYCVHVHISKYGVHVYKYYIYIYILNMVLQNKSMQWLKKMFTVYYSKSADKS